MLLRRGRELGLLTVLRVFAIDSKAVSNLGRETEGGMPDVIEILPGTLCKVLRRLSRELPVPLIAGGLLSDKADVLASLGAGALVRLRQRREPVGAVSVPKELPCRGDCRVQAVACEAAVLWRCGAETMENRHSATAWEENVKRMGCRMGT